METRKSCVRVKSKGGFGVLSLHSSDRSQHWSLEESAVSQSLSHPLESGACLHCSPETALLGSHQWLIGRPSCCQGHSRVGQPASTSWTVLGTNETLSAWEHVPRTHTPLVLLLPHISVLAPGLVPGLPLRSGLVPLLALAGLMAYLVHPNANRDFFPGLQNHTGPRFKLSPKPRSDSSPTCYLN